MHKTKRSATKQAKAPQAPAQPVQAMTKSSRRTARLTAKRRLHTASPSTSPTLAASLRQSHQLGFRATTTQRSSHGQATGANIPNRLLVEFPHPPTPGPEQRDPLSVRQYTQEKAKWDTDPNCKATVAPSYRNVIHRPSWLQCRDMATHGRTRELEAWLRVPENKNKVNLNAQDWFGSTFLYTASKKHLAGTAKVLLRHGADPNFPAAEGTPIFAAVATLDAAIVKTLIQYGANVNHVIPGSGQTPLMVAASVENAAYALLLLENGAEVNSRDSNGRTPLMYAARRSTHQLCAILVERGADIHAVDASGMTALAYAHDRAKKAERDPRIAHGVIEYLSAFEEAVPAPEAAGAGAGAGAVAGAGAGVEKQGESKL